MKKKKFCLFIVFLFIVSFVNAQQFNLVSNDKIELCPCSNQAYNILLQNLGTQPVTYQISKSGIASEWVDIKPASLKLNPNTATNLVVSVNSPCNTFGEFDLNTFATTASGQTKLITQNLNFLSCYNFDINLGKVQDFNEDLRTINFIEFDGSYEVCEEDQQVIPISIENKESYGNTYSVLLDGEEWSNLNVKEFQLGGNQKGILALILEPSTGSRGDYNLKLEIETLFGEVKVSKNIELKVEKCFDVSLDIKKRQVDLCTGDLENYDVIIKNDGIDQSLDLDIEGPDFASLPLYDSIDIKENQERSIEIEINPGEDDLGNFEVKVIASNINIEVEDTISFDIIDKNICYMAEIDLEGPIKNKYSHEVLPVPIFNLGSRKTAYLISVDGPDWVSIIQDELELNPSQRGNINLDIDPDENIPEGTYGIFIKAESNQEVYSKNVDIILKKENKFFKTLKASIRYYQYYIYLAILIIILVIIFWNPVMKQLEISKVKREKERVKREARREREEERRRKREEKEALKEKEEKKKFEEKKRPEKIEKKKEKKKSFPKLYLIIGFIVILIGAFVFAGIYFDLFEKLPTDIYYPILEIVYGSYAYLYYILSGIVLVIISIITYIKLKKNRNKGKKVITKPKKEKKKIKFFENTFFRISLLILISIIIAAFFYGKNLIDYIKNFTTIYLYYFIVGILVLIVLILLVRFYKPIVDFLLEEDNKKWMGTERFELPSGAIFKGIINSSP